MAYTSDDLVTAVRRRARIADGSSALSDTEILGITDEEIDLTIVPLVREAHGEYWVASEDQSIVSGTQSYRIPWRAQHAKLRDVTLVDSNSNEWSIPEVPLEQRGRYTAGAGVWWSSGAAYCIQNASIVLLPSPTTSGVTLRVRYYRRPGRLVATTAAAQVTSIAETVVTFGTVPAAWTTSNVFDIIDEDPPFPAIYDSLSDASDVSTGGSGTITSVLGSAATSVGEWWALEGESPIPQIPSEFHALLTALVTLRVQQICGYDDEAVLTARLVDSYMKRAEQAIKPRNDGESRPLVNPSSVLRGGRRWR